MKKLFTSIFIVIMGVTLVGCTKTNNINKLPNFTSADTRETIEKTMNEREIDFFIEDSITEDFSLDNKFNKFDDKYNPGDTIRDGDYVTVYVYRYVNFELIISKYIHREDPGATGIKNMAIELYNPTDHEVDLSKYKIGIYFDGSTKVGESIGLTGKLGSKKTYSIVNDKSEASILAVADLKTEQLYFDGDEAISILDSKNYAIDTIGLKGRPLKTLDQTIILRSPDVTKGSTLYNVNEWFVYYKDFNQIITNKNFPITPSKGFTYHDEDKALPFEQKRGMVRVEFIRNADGDTTYFKVIDPEQSHINFEGDNRVRYIGINTREMSSTDPIDLQHAKNALRYLDTLLGNAKEIYVQHDPSGRIDNYGRNLGLVWADGELVNYLIVKNGHSPSTYADTNPFFIYEGSLLSSWFQRAEREAKAAKLGIWV